MALAWLLDTNILSDLLRNPQGRVMREIERVGETSICTSVIVAAELRYGAAKAQSGSLQDRVEQVLSALEVLPFEPPADRHYAEIRHELTRSGLPIGANDLLIAAQARAQKLTVITANEREFSRVPGLAVANWLA